MSGFQRGARRSDSAPDCAPPLVPARVAVADLINVLALGILADVDTGLNQVAVGITLGHVNLLSRLAVPPAAPTVRGRFA